QVLRQDEFPVGERHRLDRDQLRHRGIVHEDVDAAITLDRELDERAGLCLDRDIALREENVVSGGLELVLELAAGLRASRTEAPPPAFPSKQADDRRADTGRAARDQRDLAAKPHRAFVSAATGGAGVHCLRAGTCRLSQTFLNWLTARRASSPASTSHSE